MRTRIGWTYAGILLAAACDGGTDPSASALSIGAPTITANPANVLSAIVTIPVTGADSVVVHYRKAPTENGPGGHDASTPAARPVRDTAVSLVLGLAPNTLYWMRPVAFAEGRETGSREYEFTTGSLPDDLPSYTTETGSDDDPSSGYVVFGAGMYGIVIDNSGRVVWYYRFPNGPGLNFEPQPNGRFVARPPSSDPTDRGAFLEIDPAGNVTRTLRCANELVTRFHDMIARPDGSYWIMCDETRTMDLSAVGGVANAAVTGTVVQHVGSTGELLFQWSPFDHFEITDADAATRSGAAVNWTHGNAIDIGADGNLVVSFRSLSEVTGIDARTGEVLWRLGGIRNQFTFTGTPLPAFMRQHGVRITGPGEITLLDNLGDPLESRVERYAVDPLRKTATLLSSFSPSVRTVALLGGTTQRLSNGNTLAAYGNGNRVEEYDRLGNVVWKIRGNAGYVFRAQRITSLYSPGVRP